MPYIAKPSTTESPDGSSVYDFFTVYTVADADGNNVNMLQLECIGSVAEINARIADSQSKLDAIAILESQQELPLEEPAE